MLAKTFSKSRVLPLVGIRSLQTKSHTHVTPEFSAFEEQMWHAYEAVAPEATKIHDLFLAEGETLINDHVAFRTFSHHKVDLMVFGRHLEKTLDYKPKNFYDIPDKNLAAIHFEHVSKSPEYPLIFVSQLQLENLSKPNRELIEKMVDTIDSDYIPLDDPNFFTQGKPWAPILISEFENLRNETDYGAWVAAHGFIPNHFTVSVENLSGFNNLVAVNDWLENHGFLLNAAGGKVKGTVEMGLMQSSTMAPHVNVEFADGIKEIRGAYYEFAERFDVGGETFRGFVGESASKIFESTYHR